MTGGTIAGNVAIKEDASLSKDEQEDLRKKLFEEAINRALEPTKKYLEDMYEIKMDINLETLIDIDSSDIEPTHWKQLTDLIKEEYNKYDSSIITHGTNTLGYTCAALTFALANPNKPIIFGISGQEWNHWQRFELSHCKQRAHRCASVLT